MLSSLLESNRQGARASNILYALKPSMSFEEADRTVRAPKSVAVLCLYIALGAVYAKRQIKKEAEAVLFCAVAGFQTQNVEKDMRMLTTTLRLGGVYGRRKLSRAVRVYHMAVQGFRSGRRALPEAEGVYVLALQGMESQQDRIPSIPSC